MDRERERERERDRLRERERKLIKGRHATSVRTGDI